MLGVACGEEVAGEAILADSVYAQVVARLHLVGNPTDTARQREADSARTEILADYGVTAEQLLAFAEATGRQPERNREIWEQIGNLVDSIREADGLSPDVSEDVADGDLRVLAEDDTLAAPGIRAGQRDARDATSAVDSAADAAAPLDTPKPVRGERPDRPVTGQPVRRP